MTSNQYDAIIIGGSHNEFVAGAYLACAGKKIVTLKHMRSATTYFYGAQKFPVITIRQSKLTESS